MFPGMEFRSTRCVWCSLRDKPIEACAPCPKYRRYGLDLEQEMTQHAFCSICTNRDNSDLAVFCRTNRFLQEDSGEDFECYRFCPRAGSAP